MYPYINCEKSQGCKGNFVEYMYTCFSASMIYYLYYNIVGRGDGVSLSKAQAEANKKYHNKFDDIKVRVPKGERQVWQDHAATQNESLNGFIMRAVSETMERDLKK